MNLDDLRKSTKKPSAEGDSHLNEKEEYQDRVQIITFWLLLESSWDKLYKLKQSTFCKQKECLLGHSVICL